MGLGNKLWKWELSILSNYSLKKLLAFVMTLGLMKLEFLVPKKTTRDQSYFNEIVADTEPLPFYQGSYSWVMGTM